MPRPTSTFAVASLVAALPASINGHPPADFRLIPAGLFRSTDGSGRPKGLPGWKLDEVAARRVIAAAAARTSDYVFDYEHQTLHAANNGKPAPASGWFKQLEWRPDGLYVIGARWTAAAAELIVTDQYRYVSPVFGYDEKTGEVIAIAHAALTNNPGLDGLTDLSAARASLSAHLTHMEDSDVNLLQKLLAALGLAEATTEDAALTAVAALKAQLTEKDSSVAALTAQIAQPPDPAKYVPVAVMKSVSDELAALKATTTAAEVDKVVGEGLAAGKILPAQEAWARDLGKTNLAALTAYLSTAVAVIAPGFTQTGGRPPVGGAAGTAALTAEAQKVCSLLGVAPEDYAKTLADQAAEQAA